MSRAGYSDDCEDLWLYRANVDRAIAGKRGQAALSGIVEALDALPAKKLVSQSFSNAEGMCTLGALAAHKGIDVSAFNLPADEEFWYEPVDSDALAQKFDIAPCMAAEVMYENDEHYTSETDEQRWSRMRTWAVSKQSGGAL